jgi:hypothetical protein
MLFFQAAENTLLRRERGISQELVAAVSAEVIGNDRSVKSVAEGYGIC